MAEGGKGVSFIVTLFLISLVVPIVMFVGPLRLAPYRIILLLVFVPLSLMWLSGRFGGVKLADVLVALYALWGALALIVNHGLGPQWQSSGIFIAEALGPYLMARAFIRTPDQFVGFCRALLFVLAGLVPFVWIEAATGHRLISEVFRGAFAVYGVAHQEMRWGMHRAQGPFEHPILMGVFASAGLALFYYVFAARRGAGGGVAAAFAPLAATFFSLSLGAFVSLAIQIGLIGYDKITRSMRDRWVLLIKISAFLYVFLTVASNRGPFIIFIDNLTFNATASWMRVAVFQYASAEALRNPVFGIGMNDFARPGWVSWSVDNFWLLNALRYGFPASAFVALAFVMLLWRVGRADIRDPLVASYRKGLIIAITGVCVALGTVHVWNASFAFLMFMLGSAAWFLDYARENPPPEAEDAENAAGARGRRARTSARRR